VRKLDSFEKNTDLREQEIDSRSFVLNESHP
jgi:hypothetical protein